MARTYRRHAYTMNVVSICMCGGLKNSTSTEILNLQDSGFQQQRHTYCYMLYMGHVVCFYMSLIPLLQQEGRVQRRGIPKSIVVKGSRGYQTAANGINSSSFLRTTLRGSETFVLSFEKYQECGTGCCAESPPGELLFPPTGRNERSRSCLRPT